MQPPRHVGMLCLMNGLLYVMLVVDCKFALQRHSDYSCCLARLIFKTRLMTSCRYQHYPSTFRCCVTRSSLMHHIDASAFAAAAAAAVLWNAPALVAGCWC